MTGLSGAFRKPYAEQLAALRLRFADLRDTAEWTDLWQAEHDRAFMVAGATKANVLADLAAAVDKAISEGKTLEWFRKEFRAIVEKRGWHGWTGEGSAKGEAWRTRVIYQTNLATTYAAGERAQLTTLGYRYWVYRHGNSLEPRVQHLAWDGIALAPDHPFWDTHAPPNGWGCTCRIRGADSEAGIRRAGGDPGKTLPDGWQSVDPKTGAPKGIDKGWAYAPGASVTKDIEAFTRQTVAWPYEIGKAFMDRLPAASADAFGAAFRRSAALVDDLVRLAKGVDAANRPGMTADFYRSLGLMPSELTDRLGLLLDAAVPRSDFSISRDAVKHILKSHGDAKTEAARGQVAIGPAQISRLPALLNGSQDWRLDGRDLILEGGIDGLHYVTIWRYLRKRRMLTLVSMRIMGSAPQHSTA